MASIDVAMGEVQVSFSRASSGGQHAEMACSTNEDCSVVDEGASHWTDSRESIFSNANDREPLLHGMVPSHKP